MMIRKVAALRWMERGLMVLGITLAVWSGFTLVEGRYYRNLPIPTVSRSVTVLPGEGPAADANAAGTSGGGRAIEDGAWIARLEGPSVGLSATVLEGTTEPTLRRGAGHIEDTAFPGSPGNVGIAGHRDTTFRPVRHLKLGDPLVLVTADRTFAYRISETMIVDPKDVYVLDPTEHPTLTLVTCYPFTFIGSAPRRYIVRAELVREQAR